MRLLEYQAKQLLSRFGLRFTESRRAHSPDAAARIAAELGGQVVLKAQIPLGGRGRLGGVRFAEGPDAARREAGKLLGSELKGHKIREISVETRVSFASEYYVGATWDTGARLPVALLSRSGGISVEDTEGIDTHRRHFDPWVGLHAYQARELAAEAGLKGRMVASLGSVIEKLVHAFLSCDAVMAEINPLVESAGGELIGLDARLELDADAAYRQGHHLASLGEIASLASGHPPTILEQEAQRIDAMDHRGVAGRVVEFEGDLALLIGGGGASLTVFDAIRRYGGRPANYCEIGGNPTEQKVAALTALLLSRPGLSKLAVIMNVVNNTRADVIAQGVLMGIERAGRQPADTLVVFRVPGSWEEEARSMLDRVGVTALGRDVSLDAAAKLAVERMQEHAP